MRLILAALALALLASPADADDCCQYRATIVKCYDADTCTAQLELGMGIAVTTRIRLARIDAWEVRGPERERGLIARDWLRERIVGRELVIVTDHDKVGKYGRLVAELIHDGENISDLLIENGHGEYVDY